MKQKPKHIPVLLDKTIELLNPKPGEAYLDATAGYGGHAAALIEQIGPTGRAVLVDRDPEAVRYLRQRFGSVAETMRCDYAAAVAELVADGSLFDMILVDLGVSSPQLDTPGRGFSFRHDGPLDMRMDPSAGPSAADVINRYPEKQLAKIIADYGEERRARAVARAIVSERPFQTTTQLANTIRRVVHGHDIDPATRTFQAIRLEVNQELVQLATALPLLLRLLVPGGRLAIISFHSLEDRLVKAFFQQESRDCICPPKQPICTCSHQASLQVLTKHPVKGELEDANNPRARSAKLRAAVKLKPKQKEGTL